MTSTESQSTTPLIQAENIEKQFSGRGGLFSSSKKPVVALAGVDLSIEAGERMGILGESGCGKTTLGRILVALVYPTAGRVLFEGQDVFKWPAHILQANRRRMQIIFQDPMGSLNPRMRVGKAVVEPMIVNGLLEKGRKWKDAAADLLDRVGLDRSMIDRFPHQLSGGQRQRICIARALSVSPSLLVADEPVASLDMSIQSQILELLSELFAQRDRALLLISHDIRVVRALCDRIVVMYAGRIVEQGRAKEVVGSPRHPYTRLLIDSICALHPDQRKIDSNRVVTMPVPDSGCPFRPRCSQAVEPCSTIDPPATPITPNRLIRCHNPLDIDS